MAKMQDEQREKFEQLKAVIDSIWSIYDIDGNGSLDLDETREFVKDYLEMMAMPDQEFEEEIYADLFKQFDKDKSGAIEKVEMTEFISLLMMESFKS